MSTRFLAGVALMVAVLPRVAFEQVKPGSPPRTERISGWLMDASGVPIETGAAVLRVDGAAGSGTDTSVGQDAASMDFGAPIKTALCDLAKSPGQFDGKLVRFRASILIGFEKFEVSTSECGERLVDAVWLEYGKGPKRQPTTWCCGDLVPRDPLVLAQNDEFRRFHRYLTAQYRMEGCYEWECHRYSVTATLAGRFDAVKTEMCPDGKGHCCTGGGFGHFGASCARLVLQSVSDVIAKPIARSVYEKRK